MPAVSDLTVIDLFAGCGGLSLGLELVGFRPVLVAELSKSARETYLANRRDFDPKRIQTDVRALARMGTSELRTLAQLRGRAYPTLVTGGPPCQGFSGIGHRRTNSNVERNEIQSNHLYRDMVTVIAKMQPDMFLFENVRGLLTARWHRERPQRVWSTIRRHFAKVLGNDYAIAFDVVHGYEFGVPQNRPRVLMIGLHRRHWKRRRLSRTNVSLLLQALRDGVDGNGLCSSTSRLLPKPLDWRQVTPHPVELLGDLVDDNWQRHCSPAEKHAGRPYPKQARTAWQRAMRIQHSGGESRLVTEHEFSKHSKKVQDRFGEAQKQPNRQAPEHLRTKKFAQRVIPEHWTATPHITVASLPDDFIHFSSKRSFSVREWARLQGFPDWYVFRGPRTTGGHRRAGDVRSGDSVRETPMYTQIGNAVPVQLAAALGWHVRQLLGVRDNDVHGPLWDTPLATHLRSNLSTAVSTEAE